LPNVRRFPENPLISPADVPPSRPGFEVIGAFNAGVIEHEGEVLLLMRVAERPVSEDPAIAKIPMLGQRNGLFELEVREFRRDDASLNFRDPRVVGSPWGMMLTSISHLRLARSRDGRAFQVETSPAIFPDCSSELYGLEDPRITRIDDTYHIVYKGVSPDGIVQSLATTRDFRTYDKQGIIFCPENMDAMLFPARVGGRYVALHRPIGGMIGGPMMWLAYGDSPLCLGDHRFLLGKSTGGWDSGRVGGGAVPFLTDEGWLEIYHAATPDDHYCLGALLLDADDPHRVLAKSPEPIMRPEAPYETSGFMPNVVFTCGAVVRGDLVTIYYGASDEVMAGAEMSVSDILGALRPI